MNAQDKLSAGDNSLRHDGERQMQASVGLLDRMAEVGSKVIRDYMPDQHREFYSQLPFIVAGVVDPFGRPWATLLTGEPGFIQSPDRRTLEINSVPAPEDPASSGYRPGAGIGLLGIELHSRRRNRINGVISDQIDSALKVVAQQTMGNCPKYIVHRDFRFERDRPESAAVTVTSSDRLEQRDIERIAGADTFYVASYAEVDGQLQVDVSHRGGKPGFVRVDDNGELTIPDFSGNNFFNTLGNIVLTGKAGLVFINYETGDVLQMTGSAAIVLDSPEVRAFDGADRFWTFKPTKVVRRQAVLPLRWDFRELSPYAHDAGSWLETAQALKNAEETNRWIPMRVDRIVDESSVIRSFYLQPADGSELAQYQAGQHLPIRVVAQAGSEALLRTYTLSSAPSDDFYRISVKREGLVSSFLHDQIKPGDIIDARTPRGAFAIDPHNSRPVVLLAGGVGITPMIAMTREVVAAGRRTGQTRPVWLFQASKSPQQRAFDDEFGELIASSDGAVRRFRAGTDEIGGSAGDRFHPGRVDIELMKSVLPFDDFDFYLCGPPPFMQAMYDALWGIGVRDKRIFAEAFGPASLRREIDAGEIHKPGPAAATGAAAVTFAQADKQVQWQPGQGTLLDLAEANDLKPAFSCRGGNCGTCLTKIVQGTVAYEQRPSFEHKDDEALICCAVPAAVDDSEDGTQAGNEQALILAM